MSKKRSGPAGSVSTTRPRRKPSRMPFLTQPLTRQPSGAGLRRAHLARSPARRSSSSKTRARLVAQRLGGQRVVAPRSARGRSSRTLTTAARARRSAARRASRVASRGRAHGQAEALLAQAHQGQRRLHRDGVRLHEVQVHEAQQPVVDAARLREVAARAGRRQVVHRARAPGWRTTEITPSPPRAMKASVKASSPESTSKPVGPVAQDLHHLGQVARGLLHRRDVAVRGQAQLRLGVDVAARAARARCRPRRARSPRRRWRRSGGRSPPASACCSTGPTERMPCAPRRGHRLATSRPRPGVVAAGAGQHRDLAARLLERDRDHALLLVLGHGGALAGGAAGHEHVDARLHLAAHQPPQGGLVEGPVLVNGVTSAVPAPANERAMLELLLTLPSLSPSRRSASDVARAPSASRRPRRSCCSPGVALDEPPRRAPTRGRARSRNSSSSRRCAAQLLGLRARDVARLARVALRGRRARSASARRPRAWPPA